LGQKEARCAFTLRPYEPQLAHAVLRLCERPAWDAGSCCANELWVRLEAPVSSSQRPSELEPSALASYPAQLSAVYAEPKSSELTPPSTPTSRAAAQEAAEQDAQPVRLSALHTRGVTCASFCVPRGGENLVFSF
jgi:hypothetical protein